MRNARLEQIVTGIKVAERNMNRYTGVTTFMDGSEEYLWKAKEQSTKVAIQYFKKLRLENAHPMQLNCNYNFFLDSQIHWNADC